MFRNVHLASVVSLAMCGVAAAQPQVLSFYTGACPASGSCDVVASLPAQGFVLTDIAYATTNSLYLLVQEVSGTTVVDKLDVELGAGPYFEFMVRQFRSGVPFGGGTGLRIVVSGGPPQTNGNRLTLMGYIPGTASGNVPAVGNMGLAFMVLTLVAVGGVVFRKVRWNAAV